MQRSAIIDDFLSQVDNYTEKKEDAKLTHDEIHFSWSKIV